MAADIDTLMSPYGDDYYYDENFLIILRSYIPLIQAQSSTILTPTNQQLYKYQGDFYGLLSELGLAKQYHFAALLLNNLTSSSDFNPSMTEILIPDESYIDMLHSMYTTVFTT